VKKEWQGRAYGRQLQEGDMNYHLAQVNVGRFIKPVEDPANADFVNALDQITALAEASPGFVWRHWDSPSREPPRPSRPARRPSSNRERDS
jgi:hypothetical protein